MADYKDIYEEEVNPNVIDYTACIAFYQQSSEADQKRMRQMIEQTIIDTVYHVFGMLDHFLYEWKNCAFWKNR
ncbi:MULTISPECIES: hypothetical protein [unclassified Exiguobacterium]|uniref:hypothetical protein n=1 Tax=unclassified Exiguobacterium TaxID=2644629 RepID=UPI001BEB6F8E|nr:MULTISPECIES: hypothetical protein [unclassified Exiguobacterium]